MTLCAAVLYAAVLCAVPAAQAAEPLPDAVASPQPAVAELTPPAPGPVGGSVGLYAVAGGLVLAAGGAVLWVRRHRAGLPTGQ